jgi:hypothetical protein
LVQLLDNELDIDNKLRVLNHVDTCKICRDALHQITRDRDEEIFVQDAYSASRATEAGLPRRRWRF